MMAEMASRAAEQGPSGFSLESIMTPSLGTDLRENVGRAAAASMGSVTIWKAAAAEAVAESCRNERRENGERLWDGMAKLRFMRRHQITRPVTLSLFCQVIDEPVWIFDVTSGKIRFVLNYATAFLLEVCLGFLNAFDCNFENRSQGRTSLNKEVEVFPMEADHIWFLIRNLKAQLLDIEASSLHWVFGLNQNICAKFIC